MQCYGILNANNSIFLQLYNARKFWMRKNSSSVHCQTIAWKYTYNNFVTHRKFYAFCCCNAIKVHVLIIDLWTHVTNSMLVVNGWFTLRGSFMCFDDILVADACNRLYMNLLSNSLPAKPKLKLCYCMVYVVGHFCWCRQFMQSWQQTRLIFPSSWNSRCLTIQFGCDAVDDKAPRQ